MKKYPIGIAVFIKNNVKGNTNKDLVELVNKEFNSEFTETKMEAYKKNHGLKSQTKRESPLFSKEMQNYIRDNTIGKTAQDLTDQLNNMFSSNLTVGQIRRYKKNNGLTSGIDTKFKKGQAPHNKGLKGVYAKGSEKGWFKQGNIPINHREVGSERVTTGGYIEIKVAEPNIWKFKHRVIWEERNGLIPPGHNIMFLDCNKVNMKIENLGLLENRELLIVNKRKLRFEDSSLTKTGVVIAKIINAAQRRLKK